MTLEKTLMLRFYRRSADGSRAIEDWGKVRFTTTKVQICNENDDPVLEFDREDITGLADEIARLPEYF